MKEISPVTVSGKEFTPSATSSLDKSIRPDGAELSSVQPGKRTVMRQLLYL